MPPPLDRRVKDLLDPEKEAQALAQLPEPAMVNTLRALLRNTATPTILRAGEKINVIPSVAEAQVDCRIVPGQTTADAVAEMRAVVGDLVEIEVMSESPGIECPHDTPLFETIRHVMADLVPGSLTVPSMVTGATDGRWLVRKGARVYGFWPMRTMPGEAPVSTLYHAHNERISLENLRFGAQALWEIIRRFCGK